jgi:hypothetical protein
MGNFTQNVYGKKWVKNGGQGVSCSVGNLFRFGIVAFGAGINPAPMNEFFSELFYSSKLLNFRILWRFAS